MRRLLVMPLMLSAALGQVPLSLEQALDRARHRAPTILASKDRIAEARARLVGASLVLQKNPEMDFAAGRRVSSGRTDYEVGVNQPFEFGKRGPRIQGAQGEIDAATAESSNEVRRLLADVSRAYVRAATAQRKIELLRTANDFANTFERSMQRRLDLGDVPVLDVNLARNAASRTRAETAGARAELSAALGDLKIFLGMSTAELLTVVQDIPWSREFDKQALLARAVDRRPDMRVLLAEMKQADALMRLGRAERLPELSAGVRYERDDGDNIPKAALALTLPIFNRGQENVALASARKSRIQQQIEALRRAAEVEVDSALERYSILKESAHDLQTNGLPVLKDNEVLSARSYEEGEIGLIELLLIRRDTIEFQSLVIEKQLEAALAAIEVDYRSGAFQ